MPSILIFDLEHTLLRLEPSPSELQARAYALIRQVFEDTVAGNAAFGFDEFLWPTPLAAFQELCYRFGRKPDPTIMEELVRIEAAARNVRATPIEGVFDLLERYDRSGFGLGLCAAGPVDWLRCVIHEHGIKQRVHVMHLSARCGVAEISMVADLVRSQVGMQDVVVVAHDFRHLSAGSMLGYRVIALGECGPSGEHFHSLPSLRDLPRLIPL